MPNLSSPPAYRASMAALAVAADTARRLRHIDATRSVIVPSEAAAHRLDENASVRALAWTAHKRAYGVLGD